MKTKRRTEITIETNEVFMVRQGTDVDLTWCAECENQVHTLTVDQAAAVAGVSSRAIYRRVEVGEVHFAETPEGRLQICINSLG